RAAPPRHHLPDLLRGHREALRSGDHVGAGGALPQLGRQRLPGAGRGGGTVRGHRPRAVDAVAVVARRSADPAPDRACPATARGTIARRPGTGVTIFTSTDNRRIEAAGRWGFSRPT